MKNIHIFLIISVLIVQAGCATIPTGYTPISTTEIEMVYKKYDEFKDVTFYRHKVFFGTSPIEIYIVEGKTTYPRIVFKYFGSDWIFFETATLINSKGTRVIFSFKSYDKTTDVLPGGSVRECIDEILPDSQARKILNLINSNEGEIKLRLTGKYYKDYILSDLNIKGLV